MRSPRSRDAGIRRCATCLGLLLAACTGTGTPLVLATDEAAPDGHAYAVLDAGPPSLDATTTILPLPAPLPLPPPYSKAAGAGVREPRDGCERIDDTWPDRAASDEVKLLQALNELRANPAAVCGRGFVSVRPLALDPELRCAARLRLRDDHPPASTGYSPDFNWLDSSEAHLHDRLVRADFEHARYSVELVITHANSLESIVDAIRARPEAVCGQLNDRFLRLAGVGRSGHVWVVDFVVPDNDWNHDH